MLRSLVAPRVDFYLPFLVSRGGSNQSLIVLRFIAKRRRKSPKYGKQATHIIAKDMRMVCASVVVMIGEYERQSAHQKAYASMACVLVQ